ncbi:hypothetical protein SAMN05421821_102303 [Mucilaginibacter lappiensis]|uniref:Mannose-6-phosphate isomerase n=1 Tax=Mucilaginibacter lappiensis TaxID=354630 RepID=A0ABR6PFC4_9SPHI|nr:hypothetical protein [Mucilaginibacter lappiensis]SIQ37139.1 hypothetical protein SAMN05421821_102303 [Mucilaginibacter lappiensis]
MNKKFNLQKIQNSLPSHLWGGKHKIEIGLAE